MKKLPWDTVCPICGEETTHKITEDQYTMLTHPKRPLMQNIFPDMKPEIREQFISGYCPKCWKEMFGQ
jgi:predicted RNA-binding Zn-ribbon protein involved in translation (DUF1610 family)